MVFICNLAALRTNITQHIFYHLSVYVVFRLVSYTQYGAVCRYFENVMVCPEVQV